MSVVQRGLTFVVGGLVRRFRCGAAALGVLAAAGRLAAGLSMFPAHLGLWRGDTRVSQTRQGKLHIGWQGNQECNQQGVESTHYDSD